MEFKLLKINDLIAKSTNGNEISVTLIPLFRMQNTREGFKQVEVGKRILLSSGLEVDLNLAKEIMNNLKENEENNDDSINYPLELLIKKFKVYNPDDYKKSMQNLSYKGFNWEVIKKTIDEFKSLS